ncbi:MAG TPA: hypothetical protein VEA37_02240 [Flavobacterium sp.]|nr:hypothetical protein [Flavobacterium sp.]
MHLDVINTAKKSVRLTIEFDVKDRARAGIYIYDAGRRNTFYIIQEPALCKPDNKVVFDLPLTPARMVISIFDADAGIGKPLTRFKVKRIKTEPLKLKSEKHPFIKLAEFFATTCGYHSPDYDYESKDGKYTIKLFPEIPHTPARIEKKEAFIEASKKHMDKYTVYMRLMILCHEWAHYYANDNVNDEMEADRNGLLLYHQHQYPLCQAFYAITKIFDDSNDMNIARAAQMEDIIYELTGNFGKAADDNCNARHFGRQMNYNGYGYGIY